MLISESPISPRPRVAREIAWLAVAGTCAVYIASPTDPALTSWPVHPVWALALVLAARYGARGLWMIPALSVGIVGADLLDGDVDVAAVARVSSAGDLAALAVVALCAAVGTAHERRKLVLEQRLAEVEARAGAAEATVENLVKTAIALHNHRDRSDMSLTFLADVSTRMNGRHPSEAADAALELALARTGARAGFVQLIEHDGSVRTLLSRGSARRGDRTAAAALERGAVVFADEVSGVRSGDSDVAAAMIDDTGEVVGVLALRGVPYTTLDTTLAAEISCVARWAAPTLSRARRRAAPKLSSKRRARVAVERDELSLDDHLHILDRRREA